MSQKSRIWFNPITKEIEIEGSEAFVRIYFDKIHNIISETPDDSVKAIKTSLAKRVKNELMTVNVPIEEKVEKAPGSLRPITKRKSGKVNKMGPKEKRVPNIGAVVMLIQESKGGLSTAELKEKTGLAERQIWSIVARATKDGKIKKGKRGLYVAV